MTKPEETDKDDEDNMIMRCGHEGKYWSSELKRCIKCNPKGKQVKKSNRHSTECSLPISSLSQNKAAGKEVRLNKDTEAYCNSGTSKPEPPETALSKKAEEIVNTLTLKEVACLEDKGGFDEIHGWMSMEQALNLVIKCLEEGIRIGEAKHRHSEDLCNDCQILVSDQKRIALSEFAKEVEKMFHKTETSPSDLFNYLEKLEDLKKKFGVTE